MSKEIIEADLAKVINKGFKIVVKSGLNQVDITEKIIKLANKE